MMMMMMMIRRKRNNMKKRTGILLRPTSCTKMLVAADMIN